MKIDICMIGVVRPAMIRETVRSLVDNMLNDNHEYRMIVNVDPVGERKHSQEEVLRVIAEFDYFHEITSRLPSTPSVVKAVKWVLDQAETDLVIFKEDDIKILEPLYLDSMIEALNNNPKISSLHTDKWGTKLDHARTLNKGLKIKRSGFEWDFTKNGFYQASQWQRAYSFLPNLTRIEFIQEAKKYIMPRVGQSPTNILKGKAGDIDGTLFKFLKSWGYAYWQLPDKPKQIEDLGKEWKQKRGWKKPPRGVWQTWIK
jgi:hypothetical protein